MAKDCSKRKRASEPQAPSSSTGVAVEETNSAPAAADDVLTVCKAHLDRNDFSYQETNSSDHDVIHCGMDGVHGTYTLVIDIKKEPKVLIMYVFSRLHFPASHVTNLAEFVTRANYGLVLGNFEMDFNDREIRYKCSCPTASGTLEEENFERLLGAALLTMDRYFGNLVKAAYGVMSPRDAVQEIENRGNTFTFASALADIAVQNSEATPNTATPTEPAQ